MRLSIRQTFMKQILTAKEKKLLKKYNAACDKLSEVYAAMDAVAAFAEFEFETDESRLSEKIYMQARDRKKALEGLL